MAPPSTSASALPPLPDFSGSQGQPSGGPSPSSMSALVSGIAPVKSAVDQILAACKQVVQSGAIPGAEQVCGQIVSLAVSLLPMAAQQAMQPQSQGPVGPPVGGGQV